MLNLKDVSWSGREKRIQPKGFFSGQSGCYCCNPPPPPPPPIVPRVYYKSHYGETNQCCLEPDGKTRVFVPDVLHVTTSCPAACFDALTFTLTRRASAGCVWYSGTTGIQTAIAVPSCHADSFLSLQLNFGPISIGFQYPGGTPVYLSYTETNTTGGVFFSPITFAKADVIGTKTSCSPILVTFTSTIRTDDMNQFLRYCMTSCSSVHGSESITFTVTE